MKKLIIGSLIISGTLAIGLDTYKANQAEKELIQRIYNSEYNPRRMIQTKIEERKKSNEYNQMIALQKEKLSKYMGSYEYNLRESTRAWRIPLGINANKLQPIQAECSYYSSLACENGIYGLKTASGVNMSQRTVANNFLSFGTKVYIEGHGLKVVEDTGSPKYFNASNKFDVYVPRNTGENNSDYFKRVNAMGRKTIKGYIIKE